MAYPLEELGDGLAAFYADLRDYAGGVVVVTMSEFGSACKRIRARHRSRAWQLHVRDGRWGRRGRERWRVR